MSHFNEQDLSRRKEEALDLEPMIEFTRTVADFHSVVSPMLDRVERRDRILAHREAVKNMFLGYTSVPGIHSVGPR